MPLRQVEVRRGMAPIRARTPPPGVPSPPPGSFSRENPARPGLRQDSVLEDERGVSPLSRDPWI